MFNKLIAKLKKTDSTTHTPAELAALATIETLEKTQELLSRLEVEIAASTKHSPRYALLCKQQAQAEAALVRHEIDAERKRVASVLQRDQVTAEKALTDADGQHQSAGMGLKAAQAKAEAIASRLQPLEGELASNQRALEAIAANAQIEFDAAIAGGDPAAETLAAEKLFKAQQACKNGNVLGSPLGLRIEALRREHAAADVAFGLAEKAIEEATQAQLNARADLALVEYDRQAQALLDACLAQSVAVICARDTKLPSNGRFQTALGAAPVDLFEAQVSTKERIIFGRSINAYNQRHLPSYTYDRLLKALKDQPNLSILATNASDVSNKLPGDDEATNGGKVAKEVDPDPQPVFAMAGVVTQ